MIVVDLRSVGAGLAAELCKYVAKGSQVVRAGARAVLDFLSAMKGRRLLQPFGNLYGIDLDAEDMGEVEEPSRLGECPWPGCPEPGLVGPKYRFPMVRYDYRKRQ